MFLGVSVGGVGGFLGTAVPFLWLRLMGARLDIGVVIALWVVLFMLMTAAFWRFDRIVALDPSSGYCAHCGYDLTGNASGVCPECGEQI